MPPAPAKFYRQVDNQFVNGIIKNKLTDTQYDVKKNEFMNSADMKLILTGLNLKKDNPDQQIYIVTDITERYTIC